MVRRLMDSEGDGDDLIEIARGVGVSRADQTEAVHVFREEIVGIGFRILARH